MNLGRDVSVSVEHETCCVSVGTHVFKNEPVSDLRSLKLSIFHVTHLIYAVAGWAKNGSRDFLGVSVTFLADSFFKSAWNWVVVIVDDIVKGSIDAIVHVECLSLTITAFSTVDFGGDRS